jgi:Flp pilus assembly protein TadD
MIDDGVSAQDLLEANELLVIGDYAGAVALLERAVAEDPTDCSALTALGIAFTEGGEHLKAVKALERALSLQETIPEALEALGCAY